MPTKITKLSQCPTNFSYMARHWLKYQHENITIRTNKEERENGHRMLSTAWQMLIKMKTD